jgi:beta-1,4-N-acetylglucosaminyltransferase
MLLLLYIVTRSWTLSSTYFLEQTTRTTEMKSTTKNIFVTVGTTKFDELVLAVTTPKAIQWMKDHGYTSLTIQFGRGTKPTVFEKENTNDDFTIKVYDFQSSLEEDMKNADLILSHAGAGTVMEALRMKKKLVVVINTKLMDNHQMELANAMAGRQYLYMISDPMDLIEKPTNDTWDVFHNFIPIPHEDGDEYDFPNLLDSFLGFTSGETNKED